MGLIVWKDSYATGFAEIDKQHIKLVDIINNLFDSITQKERLEILEQSLNELVKYTLVHFKHEEELMKKYAYVDYLQHAREHTIFVEKVQKFIADFRTGNNKVMLDVINFLKDWLLNHIMLTDRKYIQTFQINGYK